MKYNVDDQNNLSEVVGSAKFDYHFCLFTLRMGNSQLIYRRDKLDFLLYLYSYNKCYIYLGVGAKKNTKLSWYIVMIITIIPLMQTSK